MSLSALQKPRSHCTNKPSSRTDDRKCTLPMQCPEYTQERS